MSKFVLIKKREAKLRTQIFFYDEEGNQAIGKTEQCHKAKCDINNIVNQYDKTGLFSHVNTMQGKYFDNTEVNEYQDNLNMVIKAQDDFAALPATIRKQFDNDPGVFLEFACNPDNAEKLIELGLAEKLPQQDTSPIDVKIVNETTPEKETEQLPT